MRRPFDDLFEISVFGRTIKPREVGVTMVIDKGLGLAVTIDLLDVVGDYVDMVKLAFASSAFMKISILKRKIELLRSYDIWVMPGGTFMEVALWRGRYPEYLRRCKDLGFNSVEISDGTIDFDLETRKDCIERAVDLGFRVLTEVGKKDPNEKIDFDVMHKVIASDLECGAFKVIIEAREAGRGVGIYGSSGKVKEGEVDAIIAGVDDPMRLEWEAPIMNQQQYLILRFGANVSLGNIPLDGILSLEVLRNNLRCDTLREALKEDRKKYRRRE